MAAFVEVGFVAAEDVAGVVIGGEEFVDVGGGGAAVVGGEDDEGVIGDAVLFEGGEEALAAIGLEVMRPVLPMLASSAPSVAEALGATAAMAKAAAQPRSSAWKDDLNIV